MVVGDDLLTSVCNYFADDFSMCISIYIDNELLIFLILGGLFGTILLNTIVVSLKALELLKSKVLKYIKK